VPKKTQIERHTQNKHSAQIRLPMIQSVDRDKPRHGQDKMYRCQNWAKTKTWKRVIRRIKDKQDTCLETPSLSFCEIFNNKNSITIN